MVYCDECHIFCVLVSLLMQLLLFARAGEELIFSSFNPGNGFSVCVFSLRKEHKIRDCTKIVSYVV